MGLGLFLSKSQTEKCKSLYLTKTKSFIDRNIDVKAVTYMIHRICFIIIWDSWTKFYTWAVGKRLYASNIRFYFQNFKINNNILVTLKLRLELENPNVLFPQKYNSERALTVHSYILSDFKFFWKNSGKNLENLSFFTNVSAGWKDLINDLWYIPNFSQNFIILKIFIKKCLLRVSVY